jgi:hypothetical protein
MNSRGRKYSASAPRHRPFLVFRSRRAVGKPSIGVGSTFGTPCTPVSSDGVPRLEHHDAQAGILVTSYLPTSSWWARLPSPTRTSAGRPASSCPAACPSRSLGRLRRAGARRRQSIAEAGGLMPGPHSPPCGNGPPASRPGRSPVPHARSLPAAQLGHRRRAVRSHRLRARPGPLLGQRPGPAPEPAVHRAPRTRARLHGRARPDSRGPGRRTARD